MSLIVTAGEAAARKRVYRHRTGLLWWDNILGGGWVAGSVVLVHGGPGAGKSTALAQAAAGVRDSVYVALEEDVSQVADRVMRLGLRHDLKLLAETDVGEALRQAEREFATLVVLDSLQMFDGDPLEVVKEIVAWARSRDAAVALVCHENKAGQHAGVRGIEHLVDATVKFGKGPPRFIMIEKNRFGPAGGYWLPLEMTERGFVCHAP